MGHRTARANFDTTIASGLLYDASDDDEPVEKMR
jgi:hypothetical protein